MNNNNKNIKKNLSKICLINVTWIKLDKKGLIEDPNIKLNNKAAIYIYQSIKDKSKIYLGSAVNLIKRLYQHWYRISKNSKSCPKFYNFIKKYGWENFRLGIIEYINISEFNIKDKHGIKKVILDREQYYLDILKPYLNVNKKAGSMLGYKHSACSRKKMSIANKGKFVSEATKLKLSLVNKRAHILKVTNTSNGEIKTFTSIRSTANYINMHHSYLAKCLKKNKYYVGKGYKIERTNFLLLAESQHN